MHYLNLKFFYYHIFFFLNLLNLYLLSSFDSQKIDQMELHTAFKKIFSSKNLHENLSKINGEYKGNDLVEEVINFISKDKKRPICTPNSE